MYFCLQMKTKMLYVLNIQRFKVNLCTCLEFQADNEPS
jgi:hypothetical protein